MGEGFASWALGSWIRAWLARNEGGLYEGIDADSEFWGIESSRQLLELRTYILGMF